MPLIGITPDIADDRIFVRPPYIDAVLRAGATPYILPPDVSAIPDIIERCDGLVFSGGDDPIMERFGEPTHPSATPVDQRRQQFELALLDALGDRPDVPVLGICLGMQYMALHAGARLEQHLPDVLPTADRHWGKVEHAIDGDLGHGTILSHHRQAITDPGTMHVCATAPDGVIEAVHDPDRCYYLGVQWHPERTIDPALGTGIIRALIEAAAPSDALT